MHSFLVVLLGGLTAPAAIYDFRFRRIPNLLTVSGIAAGLVANTLLFHWQGTKDSLEGFGLAALIYMFLYALRGIGAGDVKLMAAIGAIVGPTAWIKIFLFTAVAGALAALVMVVTRGRVRETFRNITTILISVVYLRQPHHANPELDVRNPGALRMPHGCAIGAGCALYFCMALLT